MPKSLAGIECENVHIVCSIVSSVTNDIKINEQNNPIANGPLYVQAEFGAV